MSILLTPIFRSFLFFDRLRRAVNAAPVSSTVPKNEALIAYLADKRKKKPEGQVMNALTAAGIPPSTSEDYVQQLMEGKGRAAKRPKRIASTATGGIKPEEEGKEGETKREAGADSDSKVLSRSKTTRSTAEEPSLSKPSDLESEGSSGVLDNLELDLEEYRRKLAGH